MYEDILQKADLDDDEAQIYEFLLKNGKTTAGKIIADTPLKRGNTYNKLYDLMEKGLVEKLKEGKKTLFRVEHPGKLKDYLENRERQIKQAAKNVDSIMTNLTSDYNLMSNKPGVYYFEGVEGVKKAYDEIINTKKDIDSFEESGHLVKYFKDYYFDYIRRRVKYKISNRIIVPSDNTLNVSNPNELREVKYFPAEKYNFDMDFKICDNKILMVAAKKDVVTGTLIENPVIAKNYKALFNFLWENVASDKK